MDVAKVSCLFIQLVLVISLMRWVSAQTMDGRQGQDVMVARQRSRPRVQDRSTLRQQSSVPSQRRASTPNRSIINTRNRQVSRARSFPNQGSSRNTVEIDPRIIDQRRVAFLRMRRRPSTRSPSNARSSSTSTCPSPRSIRCYIWSNDRDLSGAFRCEGRCRGRRCVLPCECSCVHPRLISVLIAMGRIRGPELRPLDNRLRPTRRQDPNTNTPLAIRRALQRRLGAPQRRGQTDTRTEVQTRRPVVPTINFGISEDVLATLIAQPVLNEIVGPQGINQIIAGEPPQLLSREAMTRGPSSRRQPDVRPGSPNTGQQTSSIRFTDRNVGIPVPISQLNLFPGPNIISADLLPTPTELPRLSTPVNDPNVQQLPGTNVLFVNLSRSGPSANRRSQIGTPRDTFHSHDVVNTTAVARDAGLVPGRDSVINTFIQEPARSSRFLPPTKAECLSLNLELWCDPQPPWDGTPGVSRWCLLNCRADNCDNQRCACSCIEEILFTAKYDQLTLPAP